MPPPATFSSGGIPLSMVSARSDHTPATPAAAARPLLDRGPTGTWFVTYRVRLHRAGFERIRRPLDTKRLHTARLRREALMAHLGIHSDR